VKAQGARWHDPSTVVVGLAIELVRLDDIRRDLAERGVAWRDSVFTDGEREVVLARVDAMPGLAARLAAKSATLTALGRPEGVRLSDVEVVRESSGAPRLELHGAAREAAERLGARTSHVTLTHSHAHAMAVVLLESETT
jgi:holo-[acyl-carrier protein] synthase